MVFRLFKGKGQGQDCLSLTLEEAGLVFRGAGALAGLPAVEWLARGHEFSPPHGDAILYLSQLEQDDIAPTLDDQLILDWESFYRLKADENHDDGLRLLGLPPTCMLTPSLRSEGALSDCDFAIGLGWLDDRGNAVGASRKGGAILQGERWSLLPESAWLLVEAVGAFARRADSERSRDAQDRAFGRIRRLAREAGATVDGFIAKTLVITPENLELELRADWVGGTQVVEIVPGLEDVPKEKWIDIFDSYSRVQDHYVMPTDEGGVLRVIPSPEVGTILTEIKRMPGRRVAGKRAQNFIRNPYAALGGDIARALPVEVFERARRQAGIVLFSFTCRALRDPKGLIHEVEIELSPDNAEAPTPVPLTVTDKLALKTFADAIHAALATGETCFRWHGREFELDGNAPIQLSRISIWLAENWAAENPSLTAEDVFDLSRYGERIAGIGIDKPVMPPYEAVDRSGTAWMPETLAPIIRWTPVDSVIPIEIAVSRETFDNLDCKIREVAAQQGDLVAMAEWPAPLTLDNARELLAAMAPAFGVKASPSPGEEPASMTGQSDEPAEQPGAPRSEKLTLILKDNVDSARYVEQRADALRIPSDIEPSLPAALKANVDLKPHQLHGVAWLQHLWRLAPDVRGCLFADDMGLGKTLQLLSFIVWQHETCHNAPPTLVVAPVSLLENWGNEIAKFFRPGLRVLTLYGDALRDVRMPRHALDDALIEQGLTNFLRPDWLGDAQVVLTTYETLRDQEFSFSTIRWGIMVCDEAQRIKTPNALVTRAAKKQNARFRIACTGTPVENRLTDLWCLFDFVQPGLLGVLTEFAKTYSKPIEARTEDQREALDTLRKLIEPQVMRRMKEDVADLPQKILDKGCTKLDLSPLQASLYERALAEYRKAVDGASKTAGTMAILSMLHTLRTICAHPVAAGDNTLPSLADFSKRSPKMRWLMQALDAIRARGEKVIVFTEFREIQRALQRYIGERFGLTVTVINGDTTVQAGSDKSRQARIDAFQAAPGFGVIILSTTAVGFGVNVQAANHVIHFTRPWNPAKEDQATDRAYRIGQTRPVTVYCPTVTATNFVTFEAKLDTLLTAKRELARDMLNGAEDIRPDDWQDL